jgi:hypothetical protein
MLRRNSLCEVHAEYGCIKKAVRYFHYLGLDEIATETWQSLLWQVLSHGRMTGTKTNGPDPIQ